MTGTVRTLAVSRRSSFAADNYAFQLNRVNFFILTLSCCSPMRIPKLGRTESSNCGGRLEVGVKMFADVQCFKLVFGKWGSLSSSK